MTEDRNAHRGMLVFVSLLFAVGVFGATWSFYGRFWFSFWMATGTAIGYPVFGLWLNWFYDLLRSWAFGHAEPKSYAERSQLAAFWPIVLIPYATFLLILGFVRFFDPDE